MPCKGPATGYTQDIKKIRMRGVSSSAWHSAWLLLLGEPDVRHVAGLARKPFPRHDSGEAPLWTEQPRLCATLPCGQPALRHGRLAARGRHGALARASSWQLPQTAGKAATSSLKGTPGIYLGWGSGPAGRLRGACRMPLRADVSLVYCVHSKTKSMGAWGVRPRAVLGCKLTSQAPSQGQPGLNPTLKIQQPPI